MKLDFYPSIMPKLIQLLLRSKAFHSRISKIIVHVQESISSCSLNKISLSSTLWTQKLIYKQLEARDSRDLMFRQFDYSKKCKNALHCRRTSQFIGTLGVIVGLRFNSSINDSDERPSFESLRLSCVRWMFNGPLRFCHVACIISDA